MEYPILEIEQSVNYCDTDAGGVVYYARYLEFFEAGRMHYLAAIGCDPIKCHNQGIFFAVREVHVTYKDSARLGDRLKVFSRVTEITRYTMNFHADIRNALNGQLFVSSDIKCVCMNPEGKLIRLPKPLTEKFDPDSQTPHE